MPAMIIGIPVYVGRKVGASSDNREAEFALFSDTLVSNGLSPQIFNRYEGKDSSKHRRNLVIAGGVTLSVIVSPVVAAVTVGK